jgi:hypothetical protein
MLTGQEYGQHEDIQNVLRILVAVQMEVCGLLGADSGVGGGGECAAVFL